MYAKDLSPENVDGHMVAMHPMLPGLAVRLVPMQDVEGRRELVALHDDEAPVPAPRTIAGPKGAIGSRPWLRRLPSALGSARQPVGRALY